MSISIRAGTSNDGYIQVNGVDVMKITPQGYYVGPMGQCRFSYVSSTQCILTPYNGNLLTINGQNYVIPSSGVFLSNASLSSPATRYYAYAYMSGTTMMLEASLTGHSRDPLTGIEIKTGDPTRTLVGMFLSGNALIFLWGPAARLVVSWFNRKTIGSRSAAAVNQVTTSTTPVELNGVMRTEFMAWADDSPVFWLTGSAINNGVGNIIGTQIGFGINGGAMSTLVDMPVHEPIANGYVTVSTNANLNISTDAYYYVGMLCYTTAGTATWAANFAFTGIIQG